MFELVLSKKEEKEDKSLKDQKNLLRCGLYSKSDHTCYPH